jgi:hypothetical protein
MPTTTLNASLHKKEPCIEKARTESDFMSEGYVCDIELHHSPIVDIKSSRAIFLCHFCNTLKDTTCKQQPQIQLPS